LGGRGQQREHGAVVGGRSGQGRELLGLRK
jgi:hypothetical protein